MKAFNQYIIEKLKVTNNAGLHICKVELDHFIPWIYKLPYYRISYLVPDDLIYTGVPFKDTMQKHFNNDPEKLYAFFLNHVKTNPIIEVESIEDYPGVWEFEFTLDDITFKTNAKYKYPLDEWKKRYPTDTSLNFYVNESKIDEKLKVTKGSNSNRTGDELFSDVIDALKYHLEDELDVKSLKLNGEYMHNHSHRIRSIDNIRYIILRKSGKEYMVATLDDGVYIKIDSFKTFKESIFSQTGESAEEVLNNILDLISNG